jgi:hypothetical protein
MEQENTSNNFNNFLFVWLLLEFTASKNSWKKFLMRAREEVNSLSKSKKSIFELC